MKLLMEKWRKFIKEDAQTREEFSKDLTNHISSEKVFGLGLVSFCLNSESFLMPDIMYVLLLL